MDNFREWLSDNLRYIMLIGGILILLLLIFFGIRTVSGVINDGDGGDETKVVSDENAGADSSETPTPAEPVNPLEKDAYPEVNTLIRSYYKALGERDVETLKTLVDNFDPSDEAKIENARYIEGYENVEVYTKKGLTEDSYIVLAAFDYVCTGVKTPVPALSKMYVIKDGAGYKISRDAEDDEEIQSYVNSVWQDSDIQKLISDQTKAYEKAQEDDPELRDFLENLGTESTPTPTPKPKSDKADTETSGNPSEETVTANTSVFVRSAPDGDSEVIGSLDEGDEAVCTGGDDLWTEIEFEGQTGYVFQEYVDKN